MRRTPQPTRALPTTLPYAIRPFGIRSDALIPYGARAFGCLLWTVHARLSLSTINRGSMHMHAPECPIWTPAKTAKRRTGGSRSTSISAPEVQDQLLRAVIQRSEGPRSTSDPSQRRPHSGKWRKFANKKSTLRDRPLFFPPCWSLVLSTQRRIRTNFDPLRASPDPIRTLFDARNKII